ncbi:HAD family hydrolase [Allobaculum sp. Allo2]|nr:HAD family hydrolase [Allobaculum sp. Allo2]
MKHVYLFDIDGTLYNNKFHEIDSHLTEEFQYLVDQGDLIYLVSSRSPYEMAHLPAEFIRFPFSGMILEGGAAIYDENKQLVDARLIRNSDVKTIRNFCRKTICSGAIPDPTATSLIPKRPRKSATTGESCIWLRQRRRNGSAMTYATSLSGQTIREHAMRLRLCFQTAPRCSTVNV